MVKTLLELGANPHREDPYMEMSPLSHAITNFRDAFFNTGEYDDEIVKLLIEHGADPTKTDSSGICPLQIAETAGEFNGVREELIKLLHSHKKLS